MSTSMIVQQDAELIDAFWTVTATTMIEPVILELNVFPFHVLLDMQDIGQFMGISLVRIVARQVVFRGWRVYKSFDVVLTSLISVGVVSMQ